MRTAGAGRGLLGAAALLLLLVVVGPTGARAPAPDDSGTSPATSPSPSPDGSASASPRPEDAPGGGGSATPRGDGAPVVVQGRVVEVVDGDTVDLADGTRVRLAITDTPEVFGGVERCGPEASAFTGAFLAGQTVAVLRPVGAPTTDRFGRTVGEVVRVVDGASLNVALVRAGLARIDQRFTDEDADLARRLRAAASGTTQPTCEAQPRPAGAGAGAGAATSAVGGGITGHTGSVDAGFACVDAYVECLPALDDLDCGDIGHAVTLRGGDDPYRLDGGDGDGRGCETHPPWSPDVTYPYTG